MSDRRLLRVRVEGRREALEAFLAANPPGCERVERVGEHYAIEVFIQADRLDALRGKLAVKVLYDAATRMQRLVKTVGRGNRFAAGDVPPALGLPGRKARE